MNITLKLFATLGDYLPADAKFNQIALSVQDGATVSEVLAPFNLPDKLVHLVLINGAFVPAQVRAHKALQDGDVLAVWPPIAGG